MTRRGLDAPEGAHRIARFTGPNGVEVEVFDRSRNYGYADVFQVRLRAVVRVPGEGLVHERDMERMGVPSHAVAEVRDDLLASFEARVLPYLFRPDFPRRLAERQPRPRGVVLAFPGTA
jgi:hypothetical protein